ncbi:ATP-binding protein [Kushneria sp. AK178]
MRARRWYRRLWPDSLFARLSLILVISGLSIQLLSSSIWYDVRYSQVLEAPARLVIFRTVEVIQRLNENPSWPLPTSETFHVEQRSSPLPMAPPLNDAQENVERLLQDALRREAGETLQLSLLDVAIRDDNGQPDTWSGLFGLSRVVGHFDFQLRLSSGQWLHIEAVQARGWNGRPAWQVLGDYALRVYLLRALALIAVALLVARLSTRPLRRLARAASALGRDIHQPPLKIEGTTEMRRAAETFNLMQRRLIDLMDERTRLLSAVSHDLRTPLTRMRLRLETVTDATQREKLIANIDQMETLIASLLASARHDAAPAGHVPFDLAELVSEVVDEFVETGSAVHWNGAPATLITGHAPSLRRVLHNLIDNALRYAGSAWLTLQTSNDRIEMILQDDGPGINEAHLANITTPRADAPADVGATGHGLGLGIVRRIVMAHHGGLSLTNRDGGGLQVVITLPADRP